MKKVQTKKTSQNGKPSSGNSNGFLKSGLLKLILRVLKLLFIFFVGSSILAVILFRFVNPPITYLMIERGFERENHGFDFNAIEKAYKKNEHSKKLIGGSTITQQTAKNVFLWPGRSFIRKGLEAYFTMLMDVFWSKKRIMEVYLNVIETGDGIYGVEAASQEYFHKPAARLTNQQAAAIASIFPSPLRWSANNPSPYVRHRQYLIIKNMRRLGGLEF